LLAVALCTVLCVLLRSSLAAANIVMIYLLVVTGVATRFARRVALLTSILSVAAFDFFCVPPYLTFAVDDYQYLITLVVMLSIALTISTMTARIRNEAAASVEREAQTQALYRLANELSGHTRPLEIARTAAQLMEKTFRVKITAFLPDEHGRISFRRRTSERIPVPTADLEVAQWVFEHGRKAGKRTETKPGAAALYLPLKSISRVYGVMAVLADERPPLPSEQQRLMEVFAGQTALSIERAIAASAAQSTELAMESETLRTSLLSAIPTTCGPRCLRLPEPRRRCARTGTSCRPARAPNCWTASPTKASA
jgi:two-component system, OmpR family, sensor histidine kinase KdpD